MKKELSCSGQQGGVPQECWEEMKGWWGSRQPEVKRVLSPMQLEVWTPESVKEWCQPNMMPAATSGTWIQWQLACQSFHHLLSCALHTAVMHSSLAREAPASWTKGMQSKHCCNVMHCYWELRIFRGNMQHLLARNADAGLVLFGRGKCGPQISCRQMHSGRLRRQCSPTVASNAA